MPCAITLPRVDEGCHYCIFILGEEGGEDEEEEEENISSNSSQHIRTTSGYGTSPFHRYHDYTRRIMYNQRIVFRENNSCLLLLIILNFNFISFPCKSDFSFIRTKLWSF